MQQEQKETSKKAWQKPLIKDLHLTPEQIERLFPSEPVKKRARG